MFLLIVLPLVAVQGLHEILPLWRPEGAELVVGGGGGKESTLVSSLRQTSRFSV